MLATYEKGVYLKTTYLLISKRYPLQGKKLRSIRQKQGLTIQEFADKTGYSWSQIQRMEKGSVVISERMLVILEAWGYIKRIKKGP